ncbi:MAG TPA: hypothetical protein VN420_02945 [Candidatus Fimivivens sp.]|nr:hypothetical protein [Candidatus Fimivivens sp.]
MSNNESRKAGIEVQKPGILSAIKIDWTSSAIQYRKYGKHCAFVKKAGGLVAICGTRHFADGTFVQVPEADFKKMIIGEGISAKRSHGSRSHGQSHGRRSRNSR